MQKIHFQFITDPQKIIFTKNLCIGLLILFLSNCKSGSTPPPESTEETEEAAISILPDQMKQAGIEIGPLQQLTLPTVLECSGKVEVPPTGQVSVHARINGFVRAMHFLPGEYVRKGALLVVVENTDFVPQQRQMLETRTRMAYAQREYERRKSLSEGNVIAQKEILQAEAEYQNLFSQYQGVQKELAAYGFDVARIESTSELQTQMSIYSPVNAYVGKINTNLGARVRPEDELYQLVDKGNLHLELQVFAIDAPKLHDGQQLSFSIPGNSQSFLAEVHAVGSMMDENSKTVGVHCHLRNPSDARLLTPGTFVTARINTGNQKVTGLPADAVVKEGNEYFVFVKKGDVFEKMPIQVGNRSEQFVELRDIPMEWGGAEFVVKGAYYVQ